MVVRTSAGKSDACLRALTGGPAVERGFSEMAEGTSLFGGLGAAVDRGAAGDRSVMLERVLLGSRGDSSDEYIPLSQVGR